MLTTFVVILAAAAAEPLPNTKIEALPRSAALPNDTPAKVELGRLLFFDPILSATRDVACATCHHPLHDWGDARPTPLGVHASGIGPARKLVKGAAFLPLTRNTPSILNAAFNGIESDKPHDPLQVPMFWDNRVQSLEAQALVPIRHREEMRGEGSTESEAIPAMVKRLQAIPEYQQLFRAVFETEITPEHVAQAIATYERTLITPDSPFDRFMRGDKTAMTPLQQRGMEVFQKAGCALCHNGPMLSDFKLHAIGLTDSATQRHEFRTPTLRNLKHTAPYMHHGGTLTLDEVLLFYDRLMDQAAETFEGGDTSLPPLDPLLRKMNMLPEDHEPLAAFLETLNSDDYDKSVPKRVPSGLPVAGRP
ncbi:cytochrome-c peroxidase [Prosthecobacter sp.]|uniref:cytochrome-c peroxidase n=1 Tax=Prosthecobacter sp. TaxID=1965333 RepID=UPI002ABC64E6|nr:cytochrome-c peroxidase [Prosthecobacter sp.]MDZ4404605.1 cytochrome-c peroxidase [Prosthecobacter sp.]